MCGFAGKVVSGHGQTVPQELLKKMADSIIHRGPDDEGFYAEGPVGFAFRRLAIIDLSPAGHQPMSNEEGSITVMLNGEIYNYQRLRKQCEADGFKFKSQSDTEVIIALYEKYGEKCLDHLRGMFSIAIWDKKHERLMLARDRTGQKPLKYHHSDNGLVFSSCLRAILQDDSIQPEVEDRAISAYLNFGFIPQPLTGYKGIKKLPPAHYLIWEKGKIQIKRYWHLSYAPKLDLSFEEACERFRDELKEAVRLRMISDVPLGVFLSGGMDSSTVVTLMSQLSEKPVNTFSIGFKEDDFNELPLARQVAERNNTKHREFVVTPDALKIMPQLVEEYEEPYADSSAIPSFYLSKMTREHVTVALNGDGGDESLFGYGMYKYYALAQKYGKLPQILQKMVAGAATPLLKLKSSTFSFRGQRFLNSSWKPNHERYFAYTSYFLPHELNDRTFDPFAHLKERFEDFDGNDPLDQVMWTDISHRLTDNLLVKVDVATMAYGLEGRSPFLDHKLMEFLAQLPIDYKKQKRILKATFGDELPAGVMKGKRGFEIPLAHWFRNSLKDFVRDQLLSSNAKIFKYISRDQVEKLFNEHLNTKIDHSARLWTLLMLEAWLQRF
ncbi:MAG: asparagine synthase (glutamine-hydrolyzing) [Candidatus Peregrinibacteria bacterium]|nr:asparagine synthase (glutamine-hydrolyzing) [Candidatus Peregrinibacteria bacterium]